MRNKNECDCDIKSSTQQFHTAKTSPSSTLLDKENTMSDNSRKNELLRRRPSWSMENHNDDNDFDDIDVQSIDDDSVEALFSDQIETLNTLLDSPEHMMFGTTIGETFSSRMERRRSFDSQDSMIESDDGQSQLREELDNVNSLFPVLPEVPFLQEEQQEKEDLMMSSTNSSSEDSSSSCASSSLEGSSSSSYMCSEGSEGTPSVCDISSSTSWDCSQTDCDSHFSIKMSIIPDHVMLDLDSCALQEEGSTSRPLCDDVSTPCGVDTDVCESVIEGETSSNSFTKQDSTKKYLLFLVLLVAFFLVAAASGLVFGRTYWNKNLDGRSIPQTSSLTTNKLDESLLLSTTGSGTVDDDTFVTMLAIENSNHNSMDDATVATNTIEEEDDADDDKVPFMSRHCKHGNAWLCSTKNGLLGFHKRSRRRKHDVSKEDTKEEEEDVQQRVVVSRRKLLSLASL